MSDFSQFLHFVFDPVKAAIARAATSSNPVAVATAAAAGAAVATVAADTTPQALSSNSVVGLGNKLVGDFEDGLRATMDSFLTALVGEVPLAGAVLAPEVVAAANVSLAFAEQHAMTYIASFFAQSKAAVNNTSTVSLP